MSCFEKSLGCTLVVGASSRKVLAILQGIKIKGYKAVGVFQLDHF